MELFESYDRRIDKILAVLKEYGIASVEECKEICDKAGIDPYSIVKEIQPIAFENAGWAYTVGAAIAIKKNCHTAVEAAKALGIGLQAFCIPGSVADDRKVGLGHGNLAAMLLSDETQCFAFLAGHESFAAAEGAIGIVRNANKARKVPLKVILNGLGKDAAQIISRINGFTYCQTQFDYKTGKVAIVKEIAYSKGERAAVRCFGADDVREGVAIMHLAGVDVSITGNSTNPTRFQHPVAGTYKKECIEMGKKYFSVASGGGTGRTLHPDNMVLCILFFGIAIPYHYCGGIGEMFTQLEALKPGYLTFPGGTTTLDIGWAMSTLVLTSLGFYMWPHFTTNTFSAKDPDVPRHNAVWLPVYHLFIIFPMMVGFTAVLMPANAEEIAAIVRLANEYEFPITVRSGGTSLADGAIPVCGGLVLVMHRYTDLSLYDHVSAVPVSSLENLKLALCRIWFDLGVHIDWSRPVE